MPSSTGSKAYQSGLEAPQRAATPDPKTESTGSPAPSGNDQSSTVLTVDGWLEDVCGRKRTRRGSAEREHDTDPETREPNSQRIRTDVGHRTSDWGAETVEDGGSPTEVNTQPNTDRGSPPGDDAGDVDQGNPVSTGRAGKCKPAEGLHRISVDSNTLAPGILGKCLLKDCGEA